jgi:hypothetical protein
MLLCLSSAQASDDLRGLQPLKQKGDWPAIERLCRERLKAPGLPPDSRAELTAELAASLAQQANAMADPQAGQRPWNDADEVLAKFLSEHGSHSRSLLLQRQRMIYAFTRGEALRQQADVTLERDLLTLARGHLQKAEDLGKELEAAIQKQLDAYTTKRAGEASFEQLVALSNDAPFRLAQVRLSLAQCCGAKEPAPQRLLEEAGKGLEFYTKDGFREDELLIRVHLALALCRRLQGDYAAASRALAPLEASRSLSPKFQDEVLARRMDLLLVQGQPQAARALLQGRTRFSADVSLMNIHAHLLEARLAKEKGDLATASRLQAEALHLIDVGEREYSAGWNARAVVVLGRHAVANLPVDDVKSAVRLAESLQRVERWSDAATAYRQAATVARAEKERVQAFELAFRSASALAKADRNQEAAKAFQHLVPEAPTAERAAQTSLLAAHARRRQWEADRKDTSLTDLRQAVTEHLQRYPLDPTAADAHFLAGLLASNDANYAEAIRHFAQLPTNHRLSPLAIQETLRAYRQLRNTVDEEKEVVILREAKTYLENQERALRTQEQPAWLQAELMLGRARLLVHRTATASELQQAKSLLQKVLADVQATSSQHDLTREAQVLVVALLGESADAEKLIQAGLPPDALPRLRQDLERWRSHAPTADQPRLATVQLAVVRRLKESSLTLDLQRSEASCLVLLGRHDEARTLLSSLDQKLGKDPAFVAEYAGALQKLGTRADLTAAADLWRRLEQLGEPGSETWFDAKYQLASTLGELGEKERALKVLRVTLEVWLKDKSAKVPDGVRQANLTRYQKLEQQLTR